MTGELLIKDGALFRSKGIGGDVTVPYGVTRLSRCAFSESIRLKSVTLPEGLTDLGYQAFENCISLSNVTLPSTVTLVPGYTFYGCLSLKDVYVHGKLTFVSENAFLDCPSSVLIHLSEPCISALNSRCKLFAVKGFLKDLENGVQLSDETLTDHESYVRRRLKTLAWELYDNEAFFRFVTERELISYRDVDMLIDKAKLPSVKAMLIKYRERIFTPELNARLERAEQRKLMRAFSCEPPLLSDLKDTFRISKTDGGYSIDRYLGRDSKVYIPPLIGRYPVKRIYSNAFEGSLELTEVVIPEGVTEIYPYAFAHCHFLENVTLPSTLERIGSNSFFGCLSLTRLKVPKGVKYVCRELLDNVDCTDSDGYCGRILMSADAEAESFEVPEGTVRIGKNAFKDFEALKTVTLPKTLESIGSRAFSGCRRLESINIPTGLQIVEEHAFGGCTGLKEVNVNSLDDWLTVLFRGDHNTPLCYGAALKINGETLTEADINGKQYVKSGMFYKYRLLKRVSVGGNTRIISEKAFAECESLTDVQINNGVEKIGYKAFYRCPLRSIRLPDTLQSLGPEAFRDCDKLNDVTLGKGLDSIKEATFSGCVSLERIVIPDNVHMISASAFADCPKLCIVAKKGSYAILYAKKHGIKFTEI